MYCVSASEQHILYLAANFKWITFFGFSPFDATEDVPHGDVFPPFISSFNLSTDDPFTPLSFKALELCVGVDVAAFEEELLRAGFPGWAEGRKYPRICNSDSAAARLASFLFGPVPCAVSPATFTYNEW